MSKDFGVNQGLVEEQLARWLENPAAVAASWRTYFDGLDEAGLRELAPRLGVVPPQTGDAPLAPASSVAVSPAQGATQTKGSRRLPSMLPVVTQEVSPVPEKGQASPTQARVVALINAYRIRGHLYAKVDPLGLEHAEPEELSLKRFGLDEVDPNTVFSTGDFVGAESLTFGEIIERLQDTYCRSIGVEFTYTDSAEERTWLQSRMEGNANHTTLSPAAQTRILAKLTDAEIFEQFLHTNYIGAKRFSLEGSESFIAALDLCIERSAALGVEEIVIGMAHRGRLNVLANILEMDVREIFAGFEDNEPERHLGRGDVKYHLGYSHDRRTESGNDIHLTLCFNPSHLEFVNPVVEGRVRAKQDRRGDAERRRVLPVLVHGDAAFIGQGIVAETLNLGQLRGYSTGGTVHIVINNQIGFTTAPSDARSTHYCTDITRMLRCPVFHVNGEDPEAVAQAVHIATEFRQEFQRDVVIDVYGYRKYGHNEADEPRFTQPKMYAAIDRKATVREAYIQRLSQDGSLTETEAEEIRAKRRAELEEALSDTRRGGYSLVPDSMRGIWKSYRGGREAECLESATAVPAAKLKTLAQALAKLPQGFQANKKVARLYQGRVKAVTEGGSFDWGTAEWLAYASLLAEGTSIRLTGQDARRGTFSHRHAALFDVNSGEAYMPLTQVAADQGGLEIIDSPLSEAGVLGFEYGYSLDSPDALVIWEAQFGDFVNGAQVIIDQFISSSEDKWHRLSGLVMLLPHGFEGQGPEHSSARLERFLMLCAEDNMVVCNPTTPAQFFHLMRRQVVRPWRKPLVVMTPKSLLRLPEATSTIEDLSEGGFARLLFEMPAKGAANATRLLLCSGKVYYELLARREAEGRDDIVLARMEQLYPMHQRDFDALFAAYPRVKDVVWVQEEPRNMGAWCVMQGRLGGFIGKRALTAVTRPESASPATGSAKAHKIEQGRLVDEAFAPRAKAFPRAASAG